MLPNFLVVGAQKSGTTSLHHYLSSHPDIYLPSRKETKFFVHDRFYSRGIEYYESEFFSEWSGQRAVGEIDPDYMYWRHSAERIARHLDTGSMRLVFILRNPVDRAFSQYLMNYRRGHEPLSFRDAVEKEAARIKEGHMENLRYSYCSRGRYLDQINRFLEYVPKERMLLLLTEDLAADPLGCLRRLCEFLGVDPDGIRADVSRRYHEARAPRSAALVRWLEGKGTSKRVLRKLIPSGRLRRTIRRQVARLNETKRRRVEFPEDLRKCMIEDFAPYNKRLAVFMKRDLAHWSSGIDQMPSS